jgi:leucyl aminopeptidase
MKNTKVADLRNTDYTGEGGSNSAAMFLKEFTENLPYIHLDIAGYANIKDNPTGCLVKTLHEFATNDCSNCTDDKSSSSFACNA